MRVKQKYVQIFADALIPLLGFFWWNWSLYFIVLFYLLDYLSNEAFLHLKAKRILEFQKKGKNIWIKKGIISFCLLSLSFFLIHLAMYVIEPRIDFKKEILNFWSYKDMGIEQGYILAPLIAFVGYQRYKMEFLLPKLFQRTNMQELWKPHFSAQFVLIGFVAFVIGLSGIVVFPEIVYILGIVTVSSVYQLITAK